MNLVGGGPLAENLAKFFWGAKDFYKAAQVFEKQGKLEEGAKAFEQAEAYDSAADVYGRIGNVAKAAEMLERGGSYVRAAPLFAGAGRWLDAGRNFEKADQTFQAGEAYVKGGDRKKALESLQKVDRTDPDYLRAVSYLGPILDEMGLPELAIHKYREAIGDASVDEDNISIFYGLGKLCDSSNLIEDAKDIYGKILERNVMYEDVQERYRALKTKAAGPPAQAVQAPQQGEAQPGYSNVVVLSEDQSFMEKSLLFRNLTFDETREIYHLAEKRSFGVDEVIIREDEMYKGVTLLQKGTVWVSMNIEGRDVRLARFGSGNFFGEQALLAPKKAEISVTGSEAGSYLFFETEKLGAYLESHPNLATKVMKNIILALDFYLLQSKEIMKTMWTRQG
jgi:tetratricopeptide (TPR) repeat protein